MGTPSKAKPGAGLLFKIDTGGAVYQTVGEVKSFPGLNLTMQTVEVTTFDSTAVEHLATIRDGNTLQVKLNWVGNDTYQQLLYTKLGSGAVTNYQVTPNDLQTASKSVLLIPAIVTNLTGPSASGPNSALELDLTLRVSGLPTVTPAV